MAALFPYLVFWDVPLPAADVEMPPYLTAGVEMPPNLTAGVEMPLYLTAGYDMPPYLTPGDEGSQLDQRGPSTTVVSAQQ